MLILLPPSEGKSVPARGKPLDLSSLSFPSLHSARAEVLDALLHLCATGAPEDATKVLGLGPTQSEHVGRNAHLRSAATARADRVYTGVLYQALDFAGLDGPARRRASTRLAIASGLFGLLRPSDRIPAYRLPGQVALPGVGTLTRHWSRHLTPAVEAAAGGGLVVDLRSSSYASFWRPDKTTAARVVTVRVVHEARGRRTVVSHLNKATKGRLVRDLLLDGTTPARPGQLHELLSDRGWNVEAADPSPGGSPRLDVVVSDL